jgi:hypothetical protein
MSFRDMVTTRQLGLPHAHEFYFFTAASQFVITVIGELFAYLLTARMRKRWPAFATA